ncbi:gliding motility-associated C-terminal domain-containing protein [Chitinophagaceae bacterium 26-R-25]|nr:gliding motility-associated C-terminal domain-containing protein [Chitinophagaceae bacterium 26-R-25]
MRTKAFALFILLTLSLTSYATTFVVTSYADSGPGTLREAIQMANANGTTANDIIQFNIPDLIFNNRIINLVDELPALTSNIIIDGTSQPGEFYGNTDAKICLKKDSYAASFSVLKIENATNVKIYGLYLYYGYWEGLFTPPLYRSNFLYGINLINSFNIEIGAPHKGNVINGAVHGIFSNSDSCRGVKISSNYIGLGQYYDNSTLDIDDVVLPVECAITLSNVKDITIGGTTAEEGNVINGNRGINIDSKYPTNNGFIKIQNNIFNRWFDRKKLLRTSDFWDRHINIGRSRNNSVSWTLEHTIDYEVTMTDNEIPSGAQFSYLSKPFVVQRNVFDEDYRGDYLVKFDAYKCSGGGLVGGEDESNGNTFYNPKANDYSNSLVVEQSGPVTILKNVFYCNSIYRSTTAVNSSIYTIPFAQVDNTTDNSVSGRATPNCRIDLYYDDECTACEGKKYIASVTADATGKWTYNANITGVIIATATDKNGYTSSFSNPTFNLDHKVIKQPTCGKKNGSITNIKSEGGESYFWINLTTKDTVSHSLDLEMAGPGEYLLFARHGATCISPIWQSIVLQDYSPKIYNNWAVITQPSCGKFNGLIYNVSIRNRNNSVVEWNNERVTMTSDDFTKGNLSAGKYMLVVRDTIAGCSDTATYTLVNLSGPTLLLDNMQITHATCSQTNGSITNISSDNVTGTPFIQWVDSLGKGVGNTMNLNNVAPGKYKLKFKDKSTCDTIITPFYTIQDLGKITIDTSAMKVNASNCWEASGTVKGININGATDYQWTNSDGEIISQQIDPGFLLPGRYILKANNSYGCEKSTKPITVAIGTGLSNIFLPVPESNPGICNIADGYIRFNNYNNPANYIFRWVDSSSKATVGRNLNLENIIGGTFYLYAQNSKGCEQMVFSGNVKATALPNFQEANVKVTDDICSQEKGAITNIAIEPNTGFPSFSYAWYNEQNNIAATSKDLTNVKSGKYFLIVKDSKDCKDTSRVYTIANQLQNYSKPMYAELTIAKGSAATLNVQNAQSGTYQLFGSSSSTLAIAENTSGNFTTGNLFADTTVYVKVKTGLCESERTAIHIKVVDETKVYVPNGFTPNADGKNDVLKPIVFGILQLDFFTIYNRWGKAVFTTKDLTKGWNGNINQLPAPDGVYIWMLQGKDFRGNIVQLKGSFVLLR